MDYKVPTFEKLYDPYDPKNFYSRYYKERELDQSQDALKPEYFGYTKPLNLFGQEDPDAEYEQWKAQTFKAPIRPKSMLSKLVDEAGEYAINFIHPDSLSINYSTVIRFPIFNLFNKQVPNDQIAISIEKRH